MLDWLGRIERVESILESIAKSFIKTIFFTKSVVPKTTTQKTVLGFLISTFAKFTQALAIFMILPKIIILPHFREFSRFDSP